MSDQFVNKVAQSGIITLNLEDYFPKEEIEVFDMKAYLFMELILKEKDFREALKQLDTSKYEGKIVALTCSNDAIIPMWAYMLVTSLLEPVAKEIIFGDENVAQQTILLRNIAGLEKEQFNDQRVVIKGCGDLPIKEAAYVEITKQLRPYAKSIMYGEPCSTVPVYKKAKLVS
jgi:hypothetical protein